MSHDTQRGFKALIVRSFKHMIVDRVLPKVSLPGPLLSEKIDVYSAGLVLFEMLVESVDSSTQNTSQCYSFGGGLIYTKVNSQTE